MTEWEKAQAGYLYLPDDEQLRDWRLQCREKCFEFNQTSPRESEKKDRILREIFGEIRGNFAIRPPFWCDYGFNISLGRDFYANHNCVILDGAKVTFGDSVFIAPNCVFSTAGHAIDPDLRAKGFEISQPITVGDRVWFGASVTVLPGVTIGDDSIIGAGSVVNRDIPSGVIAAGNPARVIRKITPEDRDKYPIHPDDLDKIDA